MENILKRPLVFFSISLIIGILIAHISNSFLVTGAFLFLLGVLLYIFYNKIKGKMFFYIGLLIFYSVGSFQFLCLDRLNEGRFAKYNGDYVTIKGFVASEPDIKDAKVSYIIDVSMIGIKNESNRQKSSAFCKIKGKILLSTTLKGNNSFLEYGRAVESVGCIQLPKSVRNPGGFDYKRYLAQKGVSALIFAPNTDISVGTERKSSIFIEAGYTTRMRIVELIERSLPRQQAGLLNGILIGYREGLSDEVKSAFSDAGLTHIMAVSGANIAFLIVPLVFIFRKMRVRQNIANVFIIVFLIFFLFITGFEPSVLRAVIMGIVILLGKILMRDPDVFTSLAFSVILLLIYSPYMLFNVGFQLSYAATLSLVVLYKRIKTMISFRFIHPKVADVISATLSAQIGVLPIILFYFNKLSIISILSNLLVVPVIEVITILGMLMALLGQICIVFSQILGYFNCLLLSFVLYVTQISASLPFATIRTVTPSIAAVIAYYFSVWLFLCHQFRMNDRLKKKYAAVILSLSIILISVISLLPGKLEVTFLDVGEGDSTFIKTYCGKTVLLDGGGSPNPAVISKVGDSVLIPYLLDKGINKIDLVIASHGHTDHIQGLLPVLEQFEVKNLMIPEVSDEKEFLQLLKLAKKKKVRVSRCCEDDILKLDEKTKIEVLYPFVEGVTDNSSLNNTSLVLRLLYGKTEVLFTGDAEFPVEEKLYNRKNLLGADILKVAHHGSDTSTSQKLLDLIAPKAAIISVGKNNFGHPSADVIDRILDTGVKLFRTDECGAVIVKSDGKIIRIEKTVK